MWGSGSNGNCLNVTHSEKINCITTSQDRWNNSGLVQYEDFCRYLTIEELELAQTLPLGYTFMLTKRQAWNVIGDGWIDKEYHSAWVSYTSSYVNGSTISIPVTHPQSWSIKIQKDDKDLWIDISESEYNQIKIGDCYQCKE